MSAVTKKIRRKYRRRKPSLILMGIFLVILFGMLATVIWLQVQQAAELLAP